MGSIPTSANWLRNKNYILDKCRYMISEMKSYGCFLPLNAKFPRSAAVTFFVKANLFLKVWEVLGKKKLMGWHGEKSDNVKHGWILL